MIARPYTLTSLSLLSASPSLSTSSYAVSFQNLAPLLKLIHFVSVFIFLVRWGRWYPTCVRIGALIVKKVSTYQHVFSSVPYKVSLAAFFFFLKFGLLDVDLSKLKGFLERFHAPPHLLLDFWTLIFGFDFNIVWQEYENEMTEMDNYNLIPGVGMHGMAALRPQDWRTHTRMANPMAAALVSGSLNQGLGRRNFGRRRSRNAGSSDTYET